MEKKDYNRIMEAQIEALGGKRPELLLHACCAPCTSSVLERLYPHFRVVLYYFNPNIMPREEYDKRAAEFPKLLSASGMTDVELIPGDYDPEEFYRAAAGLEGEPEGGSRCAECFSLRLSGAAQKAKSLGIGLYSTTLTVSPHKNAALINIIGEEIGRDRGIGWLFGDFKKKNGYLRSIELCREYGIYRQSWCGCDFSRKALI